MTDSVELRKAWERLGGHADELPELCNGPVSGLYGMFILRKADAELLAIVKKLRRHAAG
jgi:hypothetical protein